VLRVRSREVRGEKEVTGGGESARADSGVSW
jgi:hypothetical protein